MRFRQHGRQVVTWLAPIGLVVLLGIAVADAATIVALGASNTYGKGVSRNEAYPAQLEALLRARGHDMRVINAGINGDTTGSMASRLDTVVPEGTNLVILQLGGNDRRKGEGAATAGNFSAIESRLGAGASR
jgi:acyl-CoA thioesterase-1